MAIHKDIRAAIDFLRIPLIVDVLWEIRNGRIPHDSPALCEHKDVVNKALAALIEAGAVTAGPGQKPPFASPALCLTPKGQIICALIDEVVGSGECSRLASEPG